MTELADVRALAVDCGVELEYRDVYGARHRAATDTIVAVLAALGVAARPADAADALRARRAARAARLLPPTVVAWDGRVEAPRPEVSGTVDAVVELPDGGETRLTLAPEPARPGTLTADASGLAPGRYTLRARAGRAEEAVTLVVAPRRSWREGGRRRQWGIFTPVYALRAGRDLGAGHLGDLAALGEWVGSLGGGFVATLPLLATFLGPVRRGGGPFDPSPYAPVSRRYWNEAVLPPAALGARPATTGTRSDRGLVDWRRVGEAVRRALDRTVARGEADAEIARARREDPDLLRYARFRAARERGCADALPGPDDPVVRRHVLAQVLARREIAQLADALATRGVGLLLDLPVGVNPMGYDAWRAPQLFVDGVSVGAPPDEFFAEGQNWGFAPPHPEATSAEGHAAFDADLAHHMRPAATLRIDHVMGLHRLFWIPDGIAPRDGVYVRGPADELFAVLSAASHRHRCRVVGENLGTVPPPVERALARHDVLGTWVAQFSWAGGDDADDVPALVMPPRRCVASLSTHDTATFPAWWAGLERRARRRVGAGLAIRPSADGASAARAAARVVAGGDSELTLVALGELWGETEAQNVPGSGGDAPNWRRRHRHTLDEIRADTHVTGALGSLTDAREGRA